MRQLDGRRTFFFCLEQVLFVLVLSQKHPNVIFLLSNVKLPNSLFVLGAKMKHDMLKLIHRRHGTHKGVLTGNLCNHFRRDKIISVHFVL